MVNSTKVGGKVICIEIDRLTEEIGYFNSLIDYDPFVQLKIFEKLWKNEKRKGGRDFSVGIKIPSMLNKLGLVNIEARINDKIMTSNEEGALETLIKTRGWTEETLESHLIKFKILLLENNVESDDVDSYISWYRENVITLKEIDEKEFVTFFRGLIISYGDKVSDIN